MMKTLSPRTTTRALPQGKPHALDTRHFSRGGRAPAALLALLAVGALPAMAEQTASSPQNRLTLTDTQPLAEQLTPAAVAQLAPAASSAAPAAAGAAAVKVGGKVFPADGHFPQSGFVGATFQVLANGRDAQDNGKYQWHSTQSWVGVDAAGTVTFKSMPTPEARTVTLTGTPTAGGAPLSTTFAVNHWFINAKAETMNWSAAKAWCQSQGEGFALPPASVMSQPATEGLPQRAAGGALWNAWGPMALYRNGWQLGNYWGSQAQGETREMVGLVNGNIHWVPESSAYLVSCVRAWQ